VSHERHFETITQISPYGRCLSLYFICIFVNKRFNIDLSFLSFMSISIGFFGSSRCLLIDRKKCVNNSFLMWLIQ